MILILQVTRLFPLHDTDSASQDTCSKHDESFVRIASSWISLRKLAGHLNSLEKKRLFFHLFVVILFCLDRTVAALRKVFPSSVTIVSFAFGCLSASFCAILKLTVFLVF
ncbi:hypothetical protein RvY_11245 [Ramazzottius varieornatus]|uniref:Uncharacterized protein n=1 Tax=Ramazzottius varieornatus TaxID=947166 RepID=A0A1D1VHJ5_RAMVA|nr:hypothetical protein RvY_11245 [Ramazzottius varieornatus]